MKPKQDIDSRIEASMESLDSLQKAQAPDWFYAGVRARLERESHSAWTMLGSFLSRPVVALAGLCLVLAVNVFLVVQHPKPSSGSIAGQNETVIESESIIASSSSFEYENLVQP